jgi:UDP-N-acetylglucosamine 1-carboxyvinyltransferase
MEKFVINGGKKLNGTVKISGAKNAALPIMTATLLASGKYRIRNIPFLRDIRSMSHLMRIIGAKINHEQDGMFIETYNADFPEAPYEIVKTMRASIYVLGPLLARFGKARVSLPGGCAWGPRPVDYHIKGMERLGAIVELENGYINAKAPNGLTGNTVTFDIPSVGATGNILMAATLAKGTTVIKNPAREPEIVALIEFLRKMGAEIITDNPSELVIHGVKELKSVEFANIPDRIEAGTFLVAAAATGGKVEIENCRPEHLSDVLSKLEETGASVEAADETVVLTMKKRPLPVDVVTAVYPGFPTDMQAQWMALMAVADGNSVVTDTIYTDRFTHVAELQRLGADITRKNNSAIINGKEELQGAHVMSTDLRASASLIIAGLVAKGKTDVSRIYHIDRGYEGIEKKLQALGADITRETEPLIV